MEVPSDFVLRRYMPRLHNTLGGLQKLPKFSVDSIGYGGGYMPFMDPDVQEALDKLKKAAELSMQPMRVTFQTMARLHAMGYPSLARGFGTADQVKTCCKDLIDYCGRDGGFILSPGTQIDDGQEETVRAMVDFTKEYGVYG